MISKAADRLRYAHKSEFEGILGPNCATAESAAVERFIRILAAIRVRDSMNQCTLSVAKVMPMYIPVETRKFVLRILEEKIFGEDRLNVVVILQLTARVSPFVLLNDIQGCI